MANKGTIKTGFTRTGTGYMYSTNYDESRSYLCSTFFDWEIKSQDVVNGSSTIAWKLSVDCSTLGDYDSEAAYITVGGATGCGSDFGGHHSETLDRIRINVGETKQITSGEFVVAHNSSGNRTLNNFRVSTDIFGVYDAEGVSVAYIDTNTSLASILVNITLDPITKHAIITSVADFTDEDASVPVSYAMPSGMTGQIYLSLDGNANTESTSLVTVTNAGTYNYSFSATEQRALWGILDQGLDNKQVRFFIKSTTSDGTVFREPSNWVNLRIVNYMPTLDPRVVDSNPVSILLTGDEEKLIRYVSTAKFTTGADAKKHYEIATESCTNGGGNPVYGATGEIPNVNSNYFTFSATDNAGRRVQTGLEVPEEYGYWIPYVKLTCSATPTEMTADGDVAVTISGKYFEGNFSTSRPNKMYLSYELSKNNEDPVSYTRGEITPQVDGSDYSYTFTITGLEYLSVYDLTVKVSDEILTEGTVAHTILASTPIFDWGRQDFNFNVPVTITDGEVTGSVPSIVEQGTHYSGWNYRKWSDGLYECWQRKVIPTMIGNDSSASGWYSSGAILATNLSYPITFVEMPTVNVSLTPTTNTWALIVPGSTPGTTEETGIYQLLATYSHEFANRDYIFNYQVKGKWK